MRYEVTIKVDNSAFHPSPADEVARILRDLASKLENNGPDLSYSTLRDVNGNTVGDAGTVAIPSEDYDE